MNLLSRFVLAVEQIAQEYRRQNDIAESERLNQAETNALLKNNQQQVERVLQQRADWERVEREHMERCEKRYRDLVGRQEIGKEPERHH